MSATEARGALARRPGQARSLATLTAHILGLQAKSVFIWGLLLGGLGVMIVSIFPAIGEQGQIEDLTETMPQGMLQAVGVEDMASFTTIEGFLDAEVFALVVPLALPFFAILASAGAIAGAEERGTIDVLMGNPVPRWQLVAAHFFATAVSLAAILAILGGFLWGAARVFGVDLTVGAISEGVFGAWPLCLFFGGLALSLSAVFHRRMLVVGVSGAVLLFMYFLDTLGGMVEELERLRTLSVIYHYGSPILDGMDWASFAGVSAAALVLAALAALLFRRRDIYT